MINRGIYLFKAPFNAERLITLNSELSKEFGAHQIHFRNGKEAAIDEVSASNIALTFGGETLIDHYKREYGTLQLPKEHRHRSALLNWLKRERFIEKPTFKFELLALLIYILLTLFFSYKNYLASESQELIIFLFPLFGPLGVLVALGLLYMALANGRRPILRITALFIMVVSLFMTTPPLIIILVIMMLLPLLVSIHRLELINLIEKEG